MEPSTRCRLGVYLRLQVRAPEVTYRVYKRYKYQDPRVKGHAKGSWFQSEFRVEGVMCRVLGLRYPKLV